MKKRIHKKNKETRTKVLSLPEYEGGVIMPTTVDMLQYNADDCVVKQLVDHTDLKKYIADDKVNWFKVTGISDVDYVSQICQSFGLHGFDIKDLLSETKVTKVVLYSEITFVLVSGFYLNADEELEDMQLAFILGQNFVISLKESPVSVFKDVEKAIQENNITIRQKGADFLLYILLNTVNNMNNDLLTTAENNLLSIEDELIMQKGTVDTLHYLHSQRIAYMQLKRFLFSFREEFHNLLENENKIVKEESMIYFENLDDKLRTTKSNLDSFQEALMSLMDLYYNNNNSKMNEIMKRLTIVSTIFIPLTFLVGVWGMNFDVMPELKWQYGYLISWIIFILLAAGITFFMKKKKWF